MRKLYIFLLFCFFLCKCAYNPKPCVQIYIRPEIDFSKYRTLAVVGFQDDSCTPGSGSEVSDLIGFELLKRGYNVIERNRVGKILEEQKIGLSGIIDETTTVELGKILGVRALIIGTVTKYRITKSHKGLSSLYIPSVGGFQLPDKEIYSIEVSFTVKMVDVETAAVLWQGANSKSGKGKIILPYAQEAVKEIMQEMPVP